MTPDAVKDPPLERERRSQPPQRQQQVPQRPLHRMVRPALRFLAIAAVVAIPGIVLIVLGYGWSIALGIALLLVASAPTVVAAALLVSASVARWAARHRRWA
jgi:hypothetical protein